MATVIIYGTYIKNVEYTVAVTETTSPKWFCLKVLNVALGSTYMMIFGWRSLVLCSLYLLLPACWLILPSWKTKNRQLHCDECCGQLCFCLAGPPTHHKLQHVGAISRQMSSNVWEPDREREEHVTVPQRASWVLPTAVLPLPWIQCPFSPPSSCWWIWRDGAGEKRWSWLYCPCVIFIPVQLRVAPLPFSPSFSSALLSHPLICTLLDLPAFVSASASVHHTSSRSSLPLSLALSAGAVCFPCVVDPGRLSRTSVGSEERQR